MYVVCYEFGLVVRVREQCGTLRHWLLTSLFIRLAVEQTVKELDGHFTGSQCLATVGERHFTNTCILYRIPYMSQHVYAAVQ